MRLYDVNTQQEIAPEFDGKLPFYNFIKYISAINGGRVDSIAMKKNVSTTVKQDIVNIEFSNCIFYNLTIESLIVNCKFTKCQFYNVYYHNKQVKVDGSNLEQITAAEAKEFLKMKELKESLTNGTAIGYKILTKSFLVKLSFPKDTEFRGDASDKMRANKAVVEDIVPITDGIYSTYGSPEIKYSIGSLVLPDRFDDSTRACSNGIHFCLDKKQLLQYGKFASSNEQRIFAESLKDKCSE